MENGGDYPPRKVRAAVCARAGYLGNVELTLLIGSAQAYHLGKAPEEYDETFGPGAITCEILPTPHPSWRTNGWQKKNRWFDDELLPELRRRSGLVDEGTRLSGTVQPARSF